MATNAKGDAKDGRQPPAAHTGHTQTRRARGVAEPQRTLDVRSNRGACRKAATANVEVNRREVFIHRCRDGALPFVY